MLALGVHAAHPGIVPRAWVVASLVRVLADRWKTNLSNFLLAQGLGAVAECDSIIVPVGYRRERFAMAFDGHLVEIALQVWRLVIANEPESLFFACESFLDFPHCCSPS